MKSIQSYTIAISVSLYIYCLYLNSIQSCTLPMLNIHCTLHLLLFTCKILYDTCIFYISTLVEPSQALLLTMCHPKAVRGVCHPQSTNFTVNS